MKQNLNGFMKSQNIQRLLLFIIGAFVLVYIYIDIGTKRIQRQQMDDVGKIRVAIEHIDSLIVKQTEILEQINHNNKKP